MRHLNKPVARCPRPAAPISLLKSNGSVHTLPTPDPQAEVTHSGAEGILPVPLVGVFEGLSYGNSGIIVQVVKFEDSVDSTEDY